MDGPRDLLADGLEGWTVTGAESDWHLADGVLTCGGGGGHLYTEETFEDFELALEFQLTEGANSGVFVRVSDVSNPVHTGLEVQLLDTHDEDEPDRHSCGALYDMVAPETTAVRPPGEWNEFRVTCDGPDIEAAINGERQFAVDIDRWTVAGENPDGTPNKFDHAWAEMPREGHLLLQDHGDEVRFRDLRLREW